MNFRDVAQLDRERLAWTQEVAGLNPAIPTNFGKGFLIADFWF
jgi:hypothetical protein